MISLRNFGRFNGQESSEEAPVNDTNELTDEQLEAEAPSESIQEESQEQEYLNEDINAAEAEAFTKLEEQREAAEEEGDGGGGGGGGEQTLPGGGGGASAPSPDPRTQDGKPLTFQPGMQPEIETTRMPGQRSARFMAPKMMVAPSAPFKGPRPQPQSRPPQVAMRGPRRKSFNGTQVPFKGAVILEKKGWRVLGVLK